MHEDGNGLEDLIGDGCLGIVFWIGGVRWMKKACAMGPIYMKEERGVLYDMVRVCTQKQITLHLGDEKMYLKGLHI